MSRRTYGVTIDVPEEFVEELLAKGKKPSQVISQFVVRIASDMDVDEILRVVEEGLSAIPKGAERREGPPTKASSARHREWTYDLFDEYVKNLELEAERRASVGDLLSMLIAYHDTSPRPTSEDLREARGYGSGEKWFEELRTSKARLTIAAKHMGLPSFFARAYGSGMMRRHPMDESVYGFLHRWVQMNKDIVEEHKKSATPRSVE
jgi:hypothetical protein